MASVLCRSRSHRSGGGSFWPNAEKTYAYGTRTTGAYELFLSGSYEENALMNAEALILGTTPDFTNAIKVINAVKDYQGAGAAVHAPATTDVNAAMTALTKERRVALAFRGLSYFDLRRWGWTYDVSKGGGAYKQTVVLPGAVTLNIYPNATISYNYMDYWDVPGDETELNPAASGAEWITNPNY